MTIPDLEHVRSSIDRGEPERVLSDLEQTTKRLPAYAAAHIMLAQVYEAMERWAAALEAWNQAAFLLPDNPVVRSGLSRTLRMRTSPSRDDAPGLPPVSSGRAAGEDPRSPASRQTEDVTEPRADDGGRARAEASSPATPSPEELLQSIPSRDESSSRSERPGDANDLDRLIEELEDARIVPQPDIEDVPEPDLDQDIDDVVSETLARIYASQGKYAEAARVYDQLALQKPDRAEHFEEQAELMRGRAGEQDAAS